MSSPNNSSNQSFWTLTRIGLAGSAILAIAIIAPAFFQKDITPHLSEQVNNVSSQPTNNSGEPAVLSAEIMQANFQLLDGKSGKLSDYLGKVLIVDLWATWCGPCRQEIPHLIEMAREYKSKGVEVLGLTTEDPQTDAQVVKEFSKQFEINYPIGWADPSLTDGLMNGRDGIPQTIIIGRDGKVKKHFVGFNPFSSIPQMRAALDEAIAAG